ncbi:MAG: HD domain-containing protein [Victivallales bacterium]|nr:HD domain-containing protein [Victivallales bacterium]
MKTIGPIAVIDIGAHFVRLEISQPVKTGNKYETLEQLSQVVPLGLDVFTEGKISTTNTLLVCKILKDFSRTLKEYGVKHIKAVATSAVREASNSELFIDRVKRITGIDIKILETSEEARILFLAIKDILKDESSFNSTNSIICAIGTGSTQISHIQNGTIKSSEAIRIGSLRIVEELERPISAKQLKHAIKPFVGSKTRGVFLQACFKNAETLIAAGSSVRVLLKFLNRNIVNSNYVLITREEFEEIYSEIEELTPADIAERFNVSDPLAQSVEPSCGVLFHILRVARTNKIIIPLITTREAIIKDYLRELRGIPDPFSDDLIECVRILGERYHFDLPHAETVTEKAMLIFDKTKPLHGFSNKEKTYLKIASYLHDIGLFVNSRGHHKHSYYIIKNSQMPGLTAGEREIIACIARYHRKAIPKNSHPEYGMLTTKEKVLVNDLAAILRVADSIEFAHNLKIKDIILNFKTQVIEILVEGVVDIILESWTLSKKANLFKEVFGFKIQITGL